MAIFRQGKRIGPFDIRAGISRGDLAESAYHKTDSDPRLRQPGTYKETTIGRFRALMGRAEGYARSARFAVRINLPTNLEALATERPEASYGVPQTTIASQNEKAVTMNQLVSQMGSQVNMHCDSISMPAHDLQSEEHLQYGIPSQIVTGHGFTGTIGASFYADKYLRERHFFEAWQKMAVDMVTHKANYYDNYVGKMQILQLGSLDGEGDRDVPVYGIEAIEVYPATIGAVEYSYANSNQIAKISVAFAYKQWHNLTTDAIAGMEFGGSQQTLHDIKSRDTGLFGLLPPELQRAGRSVFNSAKTQFPIGKIFKGKVFPPFT